MGNGKYHYTYEHWLKGVKQPNKKIEADSREEAVAKLSKLYSGVFRYLMSDDIAEVTWK